MNRATLVCLLLIIGIGCTEDEQEYYEHPWYVTKIPRAVKTEGAVDWNERRRLRNEWSDRRWYQSRRPRNPRPVEPYDWSRQEPPPSWGQIKERWNCIAKNHLRLGMAEEQVIALWGTPNDKNYTIGSWGTHVQWVYGSGLNGFYLYFENGKLAAKQF